MTNPDLMACILQQLVAHYGPEAVFRAVLENAEIAEVVPTDAWKFVTHPAPNWEYRWTLRPGLDIMVGHSPNQRPVG